MSEISNLANYIQSDLLQGVKHGFFTRQGGVSKGYFGTLNTGKNKGDNLEDVVKNRKIVCRSLDMPEDSLILSIQKHTSDPFYVTTNFDPNFIPEVDALVTDVKGLLLGVQTADCVPILMYDSKKSIISAVHAGWKGALGGIIKNTIEMMQDIGTENTKDISVAIGPCIWQESYEVGLEFEEILKDRKFLLPIQNNQKFLFDLKGYVKDCLLNQEVEKISDSPYNTFKEEELFFSYRRKTLKKEPDFGVQVSCIAL